MTIPKEEINPKLAFFLPAKHKSRPTHEKAIRLIVMLLAREGFKVNWDTNQAFVPVQREKSLPLYLVDDSRRRRADIVFQLDNAHYVVLEVTTWKVKRISDYRRKKLMKRAERHKVD